MRGPSAAAGLLHAALEDALGRGVPRGVADALAPRFSARALARGQPLLRPGERWGQAFLVERGLVRMHFLRRDGKEFNKNFFVEGALVCPLTPAMEEQPSLFGITAMEPTRLWTCPAAAWRETLALHGCWQPLRSELLARLLSAKLQREHDLLALDGRRRYDAFCARFPALAVRVPLMHLATYLGMTDVSLSRLRRRGADAAG
ncbi:Crp/Fnr family transcriptional regulator [Xenophilus azovorans]|uniref:Crp/Fnr family transcriptional regulator n=1 Tax=Xenophilus azovorans TaxID=151755 RepID=UPI0006919EAE|nr:Crp/Fnr family transcriptional regulator [Xenophilus azovorans]